ncbi:MAG: 2-phosphosulfolactate phosphatase [Actinomycetota bacterium]|nr:2-phosphosulfolactate phosphatase [Actinomycetota bacterium]
MTPSVSIQTSAENVPSHVTMVVVDVIRATTTAITAVAQGRRCLIVADKASVADVAQMVDDPLLVGEIAGVMPEGFHLNNSPAQLARRPETDRPMILLSSTGSPLMRQAAALGDRTYAACLRNISAQVRQLAADRRDVVLLAGADKDPDLTLGVVEGMRVEDELCCGLIAHRLLKHGFAADERTQLAADRWSSGSLDAICEGRSAGYLARSGQLDDLDFILDHVDDIDTVFAIEHAEVIAAAA